MNTKEEFLSNGETAAAGIKTPISSEEQPSSSNSAKMPLSRQEKTAAIQALLRGSDDNNSGSDDRPGVAGSGESGGAPRQDATGPDSQQQRQEDQQEGTTTDTRGAENEREGEGQNQERKAPGSDSETKLSPKQIAEQLDIDPAAVYQMDIPTGDGEVVSLQKMKDAYENMASSERVSVEKEQQLTSREAALTTDIQALGVLDAMQAIPAHIRGQANQHITAMAEREYSKFLAITPELHSDENRIAYEGDARKFLGKWGMQPEDFGVRSVKMHRMIRDVMAQSKQLARLLKPEAQKPPKAVRRSRVAVPQSTAQKLIANAKGGSRQDKTAAVAALIKGQNK